MGLPLGQKGYLRVTTPQTTNGSEIKYTDDGRKVTKETHLPLTARKHLELENEGLPPHLRHTLEEVSDEAPAKVKGKPGPKPKGDGAEPNNE